MAFFTVGEMAARASNLGLIIGVIVTAILALAVTATLVMLHNKRRKRRKRNELKVSQI